MDKSEWIQDTPDDTATKIQMATTLHTHRHEGGEADLLRGGGGWVLPQPPPQGDNHDGPDAQLAEIAVRRQGCSLDEGAFTKLASKGCQDRKVWHLLEFWTTIQEPLCWTRRVVVLVWGGGGGYHGPVPPGGQGRGRRARFLRTMRSEEVMLGAGLSCGDP